MAPLFEGKMIKEPTTWIDHLPEDLWIYVLIGIGIGLLITSISAFLKWRRRS
jgi:hypothetical protein